jgi:hypothetical protein
MFWVTWKHSDLTILVTCGHVEKKQLHVKLKTLKPSLSAGAQVQALQPQSTEG